MPTTTISPNMNLPIPIVGVDPGPTYATDLNACLTLVDQHNHTPGSGVAITPGGLNINSDLTFVNHQATNLKTVQFFIQSATPSAVGACYVKGVDLYFKDVNGNAIQITQSGGIAGSPGSISNLTSPASAAYVSGSSTFVWQSAASTSANLDAASIILRNLTASSNGLTLSPPNAMGANYTLVLPSLPVSTSAVNVDSSGNMGTITYDNIGAGMTATGANAIANKRTISTAASATHGNMAVSTSGSGIFSSNSGSAVDVTGLTVTITTGGNPVDLWLVNENDSNGASIGVTGSSFSSVVSAIASFTCVNQGVGAVGTQDITISESLSGQTFSMQNFMPIGALRFTDFPAAGTYIYKITLAYAGVNGAGKVNYCKLAAKEWNA